MKIGFIVGENERHEMELSFDQSTGELRMLMDGIQVLQDAPRLAKGPVKRYELAVGEGEKHWLAVQLSYGDEPDDEELRRLPRLSLAVSATAPQDTIPQGLPLHRTDSLLAAGAPAAARL
jgi:hypothetical protein